MLVLVLEKLFEYLLNSLRASIRASAAVVGLCEGCGRYQVVILVETVLCRLLYAVLTICLPASQCTPCC
jgi:hypothetical protein